MFLDFLLNYKIEPNWKLNKKSARLLFAVEHGSWR
jgi:hypothetical protein